MNLFKNSIPCIALLAAACCVGAVPISAAVCADMIAGIVVLFLLCNPFQLLRCLSARLRLCIACMIVLVLCAVQLSMLALYARVYLLLTAGGIAVVCRVCWADWRAAELVKQSPEVDRILEHLYYHGEFEARDAWTQYGCRETRSLLRQTAGVEVPESLIASSYMPVYCLLNDFRKEVENLYTENQRLRERGSEYRHALTASDEVIQRLREEMNQLRNERAAPESETEPEKPAFSTAPASEPENQDSEILRLFESGMSLSQIGARFGISKSSAHAAKERAKKAQTA